MTHETHEAQEEQFAAEHPSCRWCAEEIAPVAEAGGGSVWAHIGGPPSIYCADGKNTASPNEEIR